MHIYNFLQVTHKWIICIFQEKRRYEESSSIFYFKEEFLLEFVLQQMYIIYLNLIIDEKAKSKCQLSIHS